MAATYAASFLATTEISTSFYANPGPAAPGMPYFYHGPTYNGLQQGGGMAASSAMGGFVAPVGPYNAFGPMAPPPRPIQIHNVFGDVNYNPTNVNVTENQQTQHQTV